MSYKAGDQEVKVSKINEEIIISDPSAVSVLFHDKKQEILKLLIKNDLNIREIENKTGLNPGTIKRHLDDLFEKKLVFQSQTIKNEYGFTLKYYRAVAKKFIVNLEWP
ncbi:MAG: winged helix-turn-helix domain-containing protein [Candidatus Hodarchaeales archaeon]|jgi:predicted transcriptional regulator